MTYKNVRGPGIALPPRGPRGFTGDVTPDALAAVTAATAQAAAASESADDAAASAASIDFRVDPLNKLYLMGDSWTYVDDVTTPNSFRLALQNALDTAYGVGVWQAVNRGIGGTTIGSVSGGAPYMVDRIPGDIIRYGDARNVQLQGGINDINLGRNATQIITSIQAEIALLDAAGIPYFACTIGPFKGAASYNSTTRGYVDTVNAWIRANVAQVVDLWALFNDTGNDGAFLTAYRQDDFHPNHAGKVLWANYVAANITLNPITTERKIRVTENVISLDQNVRTTDAPAFRGLIIGQNDGLVRPLTIRSPDRLVDLEQEYMAQYNSPVVGWFRHADVAGNHVFKRFNGATIVPVLQLTGTPGQPSIHFGSWWTATDVVCRVSTSTYGAGNGAALEEENFSSSGAPAGFRQTTWKAGGASLGWRISNAERHDFEIQGALKFRIGAAGQLNAAYMPAYANNAAAIAGGLAVGDFYATTADPHVICIVR